jgi:hypothetical protein
MYEVDPSIGPPTTAVVVRRAMMAEAAQSPSLLLERNSVSIAKERLMLLKSAGSCRIRRRGKTPLMVIPQMLFLLLPIILIQETVWLYSLVALLVMMSGYLIQHVHFIFALIKIGLVP